MIDFRTLIALLAAARGLLAACFGTAAFALATRGVAAVFVADPVRALLEPSGFAAGCEIAACAALIGATLAFLLLHAARADAEATRLATTDPLTGAFNRRTFH